MEIKKMSHEVRPNNFSNAAMDSFLVSYSVNGTNVPDGIARNSDVGQNTWNRTFSTLMATILIIAAVITVVGNMMVLTVILRHRGMQTRTNLFLINLAVADLLVGVFIMPFPITTMISRRWLFGDGIFCQMNGWMNSFCLVTSIHTLMYIGVNKFFSIVHPLGRSHIELKWIVTMMTMAWVWAAITSTLNVWGLQVEYKVNTSQCGPKYPDKTTSYLIHVTIQLSVMILPFFVLLYCYLKMFIEITRLSARLRENSTAEEKYILATQKEMAVTMFIVLACFFMMALPYVAYATYTTVKKEKDFPGWINPLAYMFLYLNSMVNPIIYAFRSTAFREGYKEILCQKPNYEINEESDECTNYSSQALRVNVLRLKTVKDGSGVGTIVDANGRDRVDSKHAKTLSPLANEDDAPDLSPHSPSSPATPISPASAVSILSQKRGNLKKKRSLNELLRATKNSNTQTVVRRNGQIIIIKGGNIVSSRPIGVSRQLDSLAGRARSAGRNNALEDNGNSTQGVISEKNSRKSLTVLEEERESQLENTIQADELMSESTQSEKEKIFKFPTQNPAETAQDNRILPPQASSNETVSVDHSVPHTEDLEKKGKRPKLPSLKILPKSLSSNNPGPIEQTSPAAIFVDLDDEDRVTDVVPLSPGTRDDFERAMARPPSIVESQADAAPFTSVPLTSTESTNTKSDELDSCSSSCDHVPELKRLDSTTSSGDTRNQGRRLRLGSVEFLDPPLRLKSRSLRNPNAVEPTSHHQKFRERFQKINFASTKRLKSPVLKDHFSA